MSCASSRSSLFSVDPYVLSSNSYFSVDEYKVPSVSKGPGENVSCDVGNNSNSLFSIDPFKRPGQSGIQDSKSCASIDKDETTSGEACVTKPLTFKRVPRQVSVKRYNFLCSDRQIVCDSSKTCCGNLCLNKFGKSNLRIMREKYLSLNGEEQDTFLISHMQLVRDHATGASSTHVEYYLALRTKCCRVAFKIAHSIGNMRLQRIQLRLVKGSFIPFDMNSSGSKGLIGRHSINWMEIYFSKQCDIMPTTGRLHLSDNFTRREVYQEYKDDMLSQGVPYIQYRHFNRLWRLQFNNVVIPRKVRMGVCSICASLKSMAKGGKSDDEIKNYKNLLKEHRESQALERSKAMHHRRKALQSPERYMCMIIDGMDQKKTCLPHFQRLPKDIGDECLVQMHLVGCLSYCQTIRPQVFLTYPNIHNNPNLTVTIMQRVLQSWPGILPPVLYVQLDNTARENKNSTVFGYLSMLVEKGLFKKIKVNFLLVGHTHDHIDQMFSRFSKKLARCDAFTLPTLTMLISEAYTPKPEVHQLNEVYDFKRFCMDGDGAQGRVLAPLNNISFNHVFLIKRSDMSHNTTMLYAKQYSSSSQWEPQEGCRFLLYFPNTEIHGAEQMPYDDHKKMVHSNSIDEKKIYWMRCLEEKQRNIERTKKYAGDQDVQWWDTFFNHQHTILNNYIAGVWPIQNAFTWNIGMPSIVSPANHQLIGNVELNNLVRPRQRDIYVGPRISRTAEARWQGNLHELQVGMLVATLAGDDELGHPFWIAKILDIMKDESGNQVKSIVVHWYHTSSPNPFSGKYSLEMVKDVEGTSRKRRRKNLPSTSVLTLDNVDILVYDFSLTKTSHLRQTTIKILKEKIPNAAPTTTQRQTRSMSHNHGDVGLQLDEDNALVASDDEDDTSQSSSSSSDGSKNDGIDLESDSLTPDL